jgi:hypothetical protein
MAGTSMSKLTREMTEKENELAASRRGLKAQRIA